MQYDKFEFSGDHEWAKWKMGVMCCPCSGDSVKAEAIGVAVLQYDDTILVEPVCESCAEGMNVLMFGYNELVEDN